MPGARLTSTTGEAAFPRPGQCDQAPSGGMLVWNQASVRNGGLEKHSESRKPDRLLPGQSCCCQVLAESWLMCH